MFDQIIFHAGHELPHISHDHLRTDFAGLSGTCNEVVDVLGECCALVGRQMEGVRSDRRAAPSTTSLSGLDQGLQTGWSLQQERKATGTIRDQLHGSW